MSPNDACCPECGEPVRNRPPRTLVPGLSAEWSHMDGEPLCPIVGDTGYEPAQPENVQHECSPPNPSPITERQRYQCPDCGTGWTWEPASERFVADPAYVPLFLDCGCPADQSEHTCIPPDVEVLVSDADAAEFRERTAFDPLDPVHRWY